MQMPTAISFAASRYTRLFAVKKLLLPRERWYIFVVHFTLGTPRLLCVDLKCLYLPLWYGLRWNLSSVLVDLSDPTPSAKAKKDLGTCAKSRRTLISYNRGNMMQRVILLLLLLSSCCLLLQQCSTAVLIIAAATTEFSGIPL